MKKAEEGKKAIEAKLKEQEEKYEKMLAGLRKQIEDLKGPSDTQGDERLSVPVRRAETANQGRSASAARSGRGVPNKSISDSRGK